MTATLPKSVCAARWSDAGVVEAMRFVDAYEDAGGVLAATASDRLYWLVRDGLAASEDVRKNSEPWTQAGRTDLTTQAVEKRLDIYVTSLITKLD